MKFLTWRDTVAYPTQLYWEFCLKYAKTINQNLELASLESTITKQINKQTSLRNKLEEQIQHKNK